MKTVTESIYAGKNVTVPLAEVSHIERSGQKGDINVVMRGTTWNQEASRFNNAAYISHVDGEAERFTAAWCRYRSELEADTLMDLSPENASVEARH